MFYSQWLLSKKGALGTIWFAAHCLKRLNKHQVSETNISLSVDKILVDEVPVVTYRVLAFLLLGVVKIFSRKVEYLYDDCNRVVDKLNDFTGTKKKAIKVIEGMRAPRFSITRPKRLELDTFDLQIVEVSNGDSLRAAEDITLEDACMNEIIRYHSPEKNYRETDVSHPEPCSTEHTPVIDVLSPYTMEKDMGSSSLNLINPESSIENLRINNFSLDDCLDPMVLGEGEGERDLFGPIFEKSENGGKQITFSGKQDGRDSEEINLLEMELPRRGECQFNTEDRQASMHVDVTFQSKGPHDTGTTLPELIDVQTPVIKERSSSSRKRKCLFDVVTVLSNKVLKNSLNDTSSLVCKRRKAPVTTLHAWKRHKLSNLPRTFAEPLFPGISFDLRSLFCGTKLKSSETVKDMEIVEAPEMLNMPECLTWHNSPDEAHIAPSTPVTQSASLRSHDDVETTEFDREGPTSTFERIEEEPPQSEEENSERFFDNEVIHSQGVNQEKDGWSDRTRLIARQLCRSFLSRNKQGQNKGISLSQTLKKKIRSESARFFYEILVLKSRGYIDVEQSEAYGDILVLETPKLNQSFGNWKI